ncbi:TetR/AcrR family transcriptional regulator [Spirosoma spitsbergense]|uniref:TetR/AcrR family transcriptional regulator n=1 Tax=Spirosoma spitsbergense TaxID=431554 RepID=UPI0003678CB4|nr:TetR/AcrR family transcriptional regulator [Spirosoma spitsbergense]
MVKLFSEDRRLLYMKPVEPTETEQRIKEAAKQIFLRRGFDGARMQDIADLAGVDKALVHYYFRSKDKLFALTFDEIAGRFLGQIGQVLTADVPFAEKIRLLIQQDTSMPTEYPLVANFIIAELNQSRSHSERPLTVKPLRDAHTLFVQQVDREIKAGTLRSLNATQLLIVLISLSLFPLVAQSLLQALLGLDEEDYNAMLTGRADDLADFVNRAIAP